MKKGSILKITTLGILMAIGFYGLHEVDRLEPVPSRQLLKDFPQILDDWRLSGTHRMDDQTMDILKVDDYIMRDYMDGAAHAINLYVGYFQSQRQGKAIHSPRQCLPGSGWSPLRSEPVEIQLPGGHDRATVQAMLMAKGSDRRWYLFWYQGRGLIHKDELVNKVYLIRDALIRKRTDGALVRISCSADPDPEESRRILIRFAEILLSRLQNYIPA